MRQTDVDAMLASAYDRKRLLGGALLGVAGATALAPGRALGAAERGLRPARAKAIGKDTMVVATAGAYQGLNPDKPNTIASGPSMLVVIACYDSLTDVVVPPTYAGAKQAFAQGIKAQGTLAQRWEISKKGTVYRFHLRRARTPDGHVLTAEDVKWSMEKALAGKFVAAFLLGLLAGVAAPNQMKAIDENTIDFVLKAAPPPYFLPILGLPWLPIYNSEEARKHGTKKDPYAQDWLNRNVAGFGAYSVTKAQVGRQVELAANPNYWGGVRQIKRIIEQGVDESSSRLQLLLSGQADYVEELTALQLDQVARNPRTKVTNFASTRVAFLALNNKKAPFDDPAHRRALAQAVPYKDIVDSIYRGRARRWKTLIVPWFQGAADSFWRYETNVEAAKRALESVQGAKVELSYVIGFGAGEQIAILVQKGWREAGLDVEVRGLTRAVADNVKVQGQLQAFVDDSDSPAVPSVLYNLQLYFTSTAFQNNLSYYKNERIDAIAAELAKNPPLPRQQTLIREAQRILVNELPHIPIAYTGTNAAHSRNLTGIRAHEIGLPYWQDFRLKG